MYGLIIDHIITYIKERYGEASWSEIKYVSGIEQDVYTMDEYYSEGLAHKIIWACHDVTGESVDTLMMNIGYSFYRFLEKFEFNKIVRVLGRTFPQFLNGLDNLHEYLRFTFPKLKPPSFYCEHESRTGLTLHYRSKRRGFLHYVQGQIKNIAKELFDTEVEIELLDHEHDNSMEHVIMRLHFNNAHYSKQENRYIAITEHLSEHIKITSDIFFDIFPFIIVFNRGMRIRNVGMGLLRVMSNLVGKKITQQFFLMRPFIRFRWEEIMVHSNNIFELISAEPITEDEDSMFAMTNTDPQQLIEERNRMSGIEREKYLSLKGQMFYMEEWESICFMGTPVMMNLNQMYKSGLFINDFALHDSSRDLVLASTQQAAELKLLLHQEAQKSLNMKDNMERLKRERKKADRLLYQMLPRSVANMLRNGESAVACCETFDAVTIMITDVVGFTTMCSEMPPLEVVEFLNELYTRFDKAIVQHGVYKVETVGDAYVVVSGAPTRSPHHAEYALDCARTFMKEVAIVDQEREKQTINIRAGMHSGSVVAGVVGIKMPRYCLFGDTVTIAAAMEQNSKPMKILVSEATVKEVEKTEPDVFQFEPAKSVDVKNNSSITTYFLKAREGMARMPSPRLCESTAFDSEDNDEIPPETEEKPIHGRTTPTTLAAAELQKKSRLSYTPVSDAEIDSYSRSSSRVFRHELSPSPFPAVSLHTLN